jgi:excisionase family DNA binding protein
MLMFVVKEELVTETGSQSFSLPAAGGGDVYTMAEAARLKGVSYHTVSRAVRRGKLPAQRLGKMAFISAADLQEWRPMVERAPRKYRRRTPQSDAAPALIDLASGERVELARQLAVMLQIVDASARGVSAKEFLPLIADRIADVLDLKRVEIWALDEKYVHTSLMARYGLPLTDLPDSVSLADIPGGASYFMEKQTVEIEYVDENGHAFGPLRDASAVLVLPLRVGSRRLGLILADRNGRDLPFNLEQFGLAQGLANLAALALERERPRSAPKSNSGSIQYAGAGVSTLVG